MSDQINTIDSLNKLFQSAAIIALGMDEAAWLSYKAAISADEASWTDPVPVNPYEWVRIAYQEDGQPAWNPGDDVCFISCIEQADAINELRERLLSEGTETDLDEKVQYTRLWAVKFTHYGPNAVDNARKVKSAMYRVYYRGLLSAGNVFLVPTREVPKRVPENWENVWYERADLTMYFNENVIEDSTIPLMAAANIKLYVDNGMERDITVTAAEGG